MRSSFARPRVSSVIGILLAAMAIVAMLPAGVSAQTNPAPQSLPYAQNFNGFAHTSATYPAGWEGWTIGTPSIDYLMTAPLADLPLIANSDAANTTGGAHNYGGRIGFMDGATADNCLVLSINTVNWQDIRLSFNYQTVHQVAHVLKTLTYEYRVGTAGTWSLPTSAVSDRTAPPTGAASGSFTNLALPAAANNQPVVQIRWVDKGTLGTGGQSSSWAINNVSVTGTSTVTPARTTSWSRVKDLFR